MKRPDDERQPFDEVVARATAALGSPRPITPAELVALDEPDVPYRAALLGTLAAAARQAVAHGAPLDALTVGWLGPPAAPAVRVIHEWVTAAAAWSGCRVIWRPLPFDPASGRLPQPPRRTVDVITVGFALSGAGAHAGRVLGFALRTLRDAERSSRVVVLDRVSTPLGPFVRDVEARLADADTEAARPIPFGLRLAWHAAWSPYRASDLIWMCRTYGLRVARHDTVGRGRRYLAALGVPLLQNDGVRPASDV